MLYHVVHSPFTCDSRFFSDSFSHGFQIHFRPFRTTRSRRTPEHNFIKASLEPIISDSLAQPQQISIHNHFEQMIFHHLEFSSARIGKSNHVQTVVGAPSDQQQRISRVKI
jgi:hypothetical protein